MYNCICERSSFNKNREKMLFVICLFIGILFVVVPCNVFAEEQLKTDDVEAEETETNFETVIEDEKQSAFDKFYEILKKNVSEEANISRDEDNNIYITYTFSNINYSGITSNIEVGEETTYKLTFEYNDEILELKYVEPKNPNEAGLQISTILTVLLSLGESKGIDDSLALFNYLGNAKNYTLKNDGIEYTTKSYSYKGTATSMATVTDNNGASTQKPVDVQLELTVSTYTSFKADLVNCFKSFKNDDSIVQQTTLVNVPDTGQFVSRNVYIIAIIIILIGLSFLVLAMKKKNSSKN